MKQALLLALLCLPMLLLNAQKDNRLAKGLTPLNEVPQIRMPAQDNEALQTEEASRRSYETAPRYAVNLEVDIDPDRNGRWEQSASGQLVWRLRIQSPMAYSINLGFSKYNMPSGGKLLLYSPDYNQVLGPFTPADNEEHEQLWTPILQGDELVIEVQLPPEQQAHLDLKLDYVNHAFQNFSALISGSCNLDVICSQADGFGIVDAYRDIIQSVAVISTGGGTFCTGFLVNNVQEDCTPFFMTANHCGINSSNAASLVTYWNYQNSTCRQPNSPISGSGGDGQLTDFNTGAIFRAARSQSDFTLVELDDPVSPTANAFFAGWDASAAPVNSAIGIHHPRTDEKRISFDNDPLQFTAYYGNTPTSNFDHLRVIDWDIGTTEPGSSGSPLFDQNKRVVGQLHGGDAACGNDDSDWYGAFATSWDAGSTASSRLKDWLDPANTGTLVLNGRYASSCTYAVTPTPAIVNVCSPLDAIFTLDVSEAFNGNVTLSASNLPAGSTAHFTPSIVAPGGVATLSITTNGVLPNTYNIQINGTDGINTSSSLIALSVLNGDISTPTLTSPADNSTGVLPNPLLNWEEEGSDGISYEVEIATDANFSTIIETATTNHTNYQPTNAANGLSNYYWHIRAINDCGSSAFSRTFQFQTNHYTCITYSSSESTVISDVGTPSIENDIFISDDHEIGLVYVSLDVSHTYIGDLDASLLSPFGNNILLFDRPGFPNGDFGCSEDNLQLFFDQNSANNANALESTCENSTENSTYAIEGNFMPIGSFDDLLDGNSQGIWTLEMSDNAAADGGVLNEWSITICYSIEGTPPSLLTNNTLEVPRGAEEAITSSHLETTDNESLANGLTFTITNSPQQGNLLLNGAVLNQGSTFTQADINNGLLSYAHNGGIVLEDQFQFDIVDETGLELSNNTFLISITLSPMNASLQLTNVSLCHGDMDASLLVIVSGGLPPYQYALNDGAFQVSNTFEQLAAGDFTVRVLDALGNMVNSATYTIAEPPALLVSTDVSFDELSVVANGGIMPYSYQLNDNDVQLENMFSNLPNGMYAVTVRDANGCIATTTATIAVNTLAANVILSNDISCHNANDASISALVSGGTPPFEYRINDGLFQNENTFSDLEAGNYQVTIRDNEGFLLTTETITVSNPPILSLIASADENTINAIAEGGTPPLVYNINGGEGQDNGQFNNLPNGVYTVNVVDANNCLASTEITIAINTLEVSAILNNDISCFNTNDASISALVNGGTPPFEYRINDGLFQNENTFSDLEAGNYQITIRDNEGFLLTTETITVSNPPILSLTASADENTINAIAEGGTPPLVYNINGGEGQDNGQFNNLENGLYEVTVIDANGCVEATSLNVSYSNLSIVSVLVVNLECYNDANGSISVMAEGGALPYTYSLDGDSYQDDANFSGLLAGSYTVWVKDADGFIQQTETLILNNPPELTIEGIVEDSTITVLAAGGTGTLMYSIDGGAYQAENVFENVPPGEYEVLVQDQNGCINSTIVTVLVGLFEYHKPNLVFGLFPNPSQGEFQLIIDQSTSKNLQCYLYNSTGEIILQKTFEKTQSRFEIDVDLSFYPPGLYEIILTDGYLLGVGRVIVQ